MPSDPWTEALRRGDPAAAWAISDAVLAARDPATRDDPRAPYHLRWVWDGCPPDGRHVLVRCYHGLGDTLQFARHLPALRRRAASLTLEAQPELVPILAGLPGIDRLHPFDVAAPLPPAECDIEIMELAHVLRAAPADAAAPYLRVPRVTPRPRAIGLCWEAGGWDPARSVPLASLLAACAGRPLASLQRGQAAMQATSPAFVNPGDTSTDILATAALITSVDAVVTVDTMVAHLAGALGRPTMLLLKAAPDWRWPTEGTRTPWYPTMTILHQATPGDWDAPLARLATLLG